MMTRIKALAVGLLVAASVFTARANTVDLAWDPSVDATGYRVYWGLASRTYTQSDDVGNFTMYTVTHCVNTLTYYFAVTAYNEFGESDYSDEISVPIPPLPAPEFLQVSPAIFSWSIPDQPDTLLGFKIFRREVGIRGTNSWVIADPAARSLIVPDFIPGSTYQFWMVAYTRIQNFPQVKKIRRIDSPTSPILEWTEPLTPYLFDTPLVFPLAWTDPGDAVRLVFRGPQHTDNEVFYSGDLFNWVKLSPAEEFVTGWYRIFDPAPAVTQRYYRITQ